MKQILTKKYLIPIIIFLYLIAVGISFAYFTASITGSETSTTLTVTGGTMTITYNGGSNINISDIHPREEKWATKTFTVTGNNTTSIDMLYDLSLVIQSNTFSSGAIRYKLISTNTGNNGEVVSSINTMRDIGTGASTILLGNGLFEGPTSGNKIHTYDLEIYFPETGLNQNTEKGKELKGYISTGSNTIIKDGLVMWLDASGKSNEGTDKNIIHDMSGNGNNGTLNNFAYTTSSGWTNNNLSFDGSDDYVEVPGLQIYNSSFTFSGWYYFNESNARDIIYGDYGLSNGINFNIEKYTNNDLRFYWAGTPNVFTQENVIKVGWNCINIVRDKTNSEILFYVDGNLVYTYSGSITDKSVTGNFYIGRDYRTGATALNGKIYEVLIYNRALTSDEIFKNYNTGKNKLGI